MSQKRASFQHFVFLVKILPNIDSCIQLFLLQIDWERKPNKGHLETKQLMLEIEQLVRNIRLYMNTLEQGHCKLIRFFCSYNEIQFLRIYVSN